MHELLPGEIVLQVAPEPLNRIQLRTVGGKPHAPDILRPTYPVGRVRTTIIHEQDVQTVGKGLGNGIHKELKGVGIQLRSFEKEALPRGRGHRAIDIKPFEQVLD